MILGIRRHTGTFKAFKLFERQLFEVSLRA